MRSVVEAVADGVKAGAASRAAAIVDAAFDHALALVRDAHCVDISLEPLEKSVRIEIFIDGRIDRDDVPVSAEAWRLVRDAAPGARVADGERGPVLRFELPL